MPEKAYVDFAKQLNLGDEFVIYLDGAHIPLHERQGTALENQINPLSAPADRQVIYTMPLGQLFIVQVRMWFGKLLFTKKLVNNYKINKRRDFSVF